MALPTITPNLDHLATWLAPFLARCGDRRTARTLTGIVGGILGSGSLVCAQIAAFPPSVQSHGPWRAAGPARHAR